MVNKKTYLKVIDMRQLGKAGGTARAAKLSPAQRKAASRKANKVRWDKYYAAHPDKVRPKRKRRAAA